MQDGTGQPMPTSYVVSASVRSLILSLSSPHRPITFGDEIRSSYHVENKNVIGLLFVTRTEEYNYVIINFLFPSLHDIYFRYFLTNVFNVGHPTKQYYYSLFK